MIALGCDYVGFLLKQPIMELLELMHLDYKDFGVTNTEASDYPHYAYKAAQAVANGECDRGILLCGTGIGVSIAANKVKGIRCAVGSDCYSAKLAKEHNDANMLALGYRVVGPELAKMIVQCWLNAEFQGGRHAGRLELIREMEEGTYVSPLL